MPLPALNHSSSAMFSQCTRIPTSSHHAKLASVSFGFRIVREFEFEFEPHGHEIKNGVQ